VIKLKIDTLLFDLDGTLVDSIGLITDTLKKTLSLYFPSWTGTDEDYLRMVGPSLADTFADFTKDPAQIQAMIHSYREIYTASEFHYIRIYPGVLETLQYFHEKKYHLAIVTTKFYQSAAPSIRHFGLDRYIDTVIALDDVVHPKPDPESVLTAMSRFSSRGAVMIGDSPSDLLAGQNAGILTGGVGWSFKRSQIQALKPDFWLEDFRDLIAQIQKYNEEE
jgi:pyrophosphatase PpaX